jgi:hypothetical protein
VVDKDKVWRDWNKKLSKFGRGTAAGVAAGAIVQGIVDGVGWIIDEGGKVTKKPTAETLLCSANLQSCYEMAGGLRRGSPESVCSAFNKKNGTVYHSATANTCYYSANGTKAVLAPIYKINNPSYNSSAPPPDNSVVFMDEIHLRPEYTDSNGRMSQDQMIVDLTTHGHQNKDIYLITQDPERLNRGIRKLVEKMRPQPLKLNNQRLLLICL